MSDVTELGCWPSCIDALDWSQDGIIALASDERVELLFPNTVSYDRDQEAAQWQHIPLQVPWFTHEELPVKEPAPLADYSIGEEISASAPIAIAWSPPGLAKHRRCALAALTANLVLSIWSNDGKPHDGACWDRRLIVNNALTEYFSNITGDHLEHGTLMNDEQMRLKSRIRAFSWAPFVRNTDASSTLGSPVTYGRYLLAVCNDDNQLAIVTVGSPTSTYGNSQSWYAQVLTHVSLIPKSDSETTVSRFFGDEMMQQKYISHVSWSPWFTQGDQNYSIVAYATNENVRARIVTCSQDRLNFGDETVYSKIEMRYNGPMKWSPIVHEKSLSLALFTVKGLLYLKISKQDASILEQSHHGLDGRWDQISGAVWDRAHRATPSLHFTSLLSTLQNPTSVLDVSSTMLKPLEPPDWRDLIEGKAAEFGARNCLAGNIKIKVWGLSTSPLGDFVAACHSLHPSDMIEYGSPNDRRGIIAVSAMRQYSEMLQGLPAQDVSAEGVLFTLKKLADKTVEDSDHMPAFVEKMAERLLQIYGPTDADTNGAFWPTFVGHDFNVLVRNLKRVAFFDPNTLKDRYTILVAHACDSRSTNDLERTLIAFRLVNILQDLPVELSDSPFSAEIRTHHQKMIALVQSLIGTKDASSGTTQTERPNSSESIAEVENARLELADAAVDTCDFCYAPILFTDPRNASCTNGHQFPRCGLSFVAIQAPGITKYCGICNTPFLNDEFIITQEVSKTPQSQSTRRDMNEKNATTENAATTQTDTRDGESAVPDKDGDVEMVEPSSTHDEAQLNGGDGPTTQASSTQCQTQNNDGDATMDQPPSAQEQTPLSNVEQTRTTQEVAPPPEDTEGLRELPVTLSRVLFHACDVCIYCGGKFIG